MKNTCHIPLAVLALLGNMGNAPPPQDTEPLIRFGLIADIQYADCEPHGSRFYRNSLPKLDACIAILNGAGVDFTINLGDLADRSYQDLDSVLVRLNRLERSVFNLSGNHDYNGIPDNQALCRKLGMPAEYYAFEEKGWVFILLNTNEIADYSLPADAEGRRELADMHARIQQTGGRQGASWNGGIGRWQLEWLAERLADAEKAGRGVIIFSHHPLYPATAYSALNSDAILQTIGGYSCVRAIFAGHHHAGGFAAYEGIPVVTMEGMVETETQNAFAIVSIYGNKILLEGYGRTARRVFEF